MVKRSIGVLLLVLASVCTVTAQSTSALRIDIIAYIIRQHLVYPQS